MEKKIFFLIWNMSHCGGTERVLSIIANGLSEKGYQVSIFSYEGGKRSYFLLNSEIKLYWLNSIHNTNNYLKTLSRMATYLKNENSYFLIDVDIMNGFFSIIMKILMPKLHWISWDHFGYYFKTDSKKYNYQRKIMKKMIYRFADQLLVITEADKAYYQKDSRTKCRIVKIYNPLPYNGKFIKRVEKPIIFAAGRLVDEKGFDLLINSWKILEKRYPVWSLIIAGEGKKRKDLEAQVRLSGLKNIEFVGNIHNIEQIYQKASFFVLPSRNEPFGMVIIEAMYFSLPVVSYACSDGPKEIISDGKNGFLIEPFDIEEFALKMELLMKDEKLRMKMGEEAQKSLEKFEKEKILDQWKVILNLLKKTK